MFQAVIIYVLRDLPVTIYTDDILIVTEDSERKKLDLLEELIKRFTDAALKSSLQKMHIMRN